MLETISSRKTNLVFRLILGAFLLIAFRVWHLEVIQREEKIKQADRPKTRGIVLKADRGTIYDRFHIPLAVNKICYKASIYFNQIAQIPAVSWREDLETGKRIRTTPRRDYIKELSLVLGNILDLDPLRIEDLIHSKASLFPHVPFVIKSFLSEKEHYRLAALEKDWLGIHAEISSERFYPKGRVACDILGTMGSISSKEYFSIAAEIETLQSTIDDWEWGRSYQLPTGYRSFEQAVVRLEELKEKAYTIQDLVGKSGIEGQFEQQLRGFYGKKIYEVDQKGKFLREMRGSKQATPGQQITLTISSELQEFAESLLAQDEAAREGKSIGFDPNLKIRKSLKQPWVKGGSIVVLDPNNGEVLAMASTPRFDPNDFIPAANPALHAQKQQNINRWLENEKAIGAIWDGKQPLQRERFTPQKGFYDEKAPLTWDLFLQLILPQEGSIRAFFTKVDDVKTAVQIQEDFETVLFASGIREPEKLLDALYPQIKIELRQKNSEVSSALKRLDHHLAPLGSNGDRLFAIDLCRLVVHAPAFSDETLKLLGSMKLSLYRTCNQEICAKEASLKEEAFIEFHEKQFLPWCQLHQKEFLCEMRKIEKEKKLSPRPYLDYLDQKEKELFSLHWNEQRLHLLQKSLPESLKTYCHKFSPEEIRGIVHTFRSYHELARPLLGNYKKLRKKEQTEKELAASFYPIGGFGHSRSFSFQAPGPQGSIFKVVTSYAALLQSGGVNPLTLIDEVKGNSVATSVNGTPYLRSYKGGRLPKSHAPQIGKVDLTSALEQTSNPYFSILAGDFLRDPDDLTKAAFLLGFGTPTGIDLPGEAKGNLPTDLKTNRTGLYSTAIGQHTLLTTPLQTSVMMSAIANGGKVLKPQIIKKTEGVIPNRLPWSAFEHPDAIAQKELQTLGFGFPLFTASISRTESDFVQTKTEHIVRTVPLPSSVRNLILEGLDRTVWGAKGTARPSIQRALAKHPDLFAQYQALRHQMVGKTSTAEVLFNPNINPSSLPTLYKHISFGAIAFDPNSVRFDTPELTVIVTLRYGSGGKDAAPLASQIITKWREIKTRHSTPSMIK